VERGDGSINGKIQQKVGVRNAALNMLFKWCHRHLGQQGAALHGGETLLSLHNCGQHALWLQGSGCHSDMDYPGGFINDSELFMGGLRSCQDTLMINLDHQCFSSPEWFGRVG
jgi:hypothetical protein